MKFFGPKSLSHYLFYSIRVVTIVCILLLAFILHSFVIGNFELIGNRFQIKIPLFPKTYIEGFYQVNIITTITVTMVYFTLFFYLLSNILKTFKASKLFTSKVIKELNYFAILNLVAGPILYLIIHFIIMNKSNYKDIFNLILSLLLGVFVLFITAIFKRGFYVQSENDLTI